MGHIVARVVETGLPVVYLNSVGGRTTRSMTAPVSS